MRLVKSVRGRRGLSSSPSRSAPRKRRSRRRLPRRAAESAAGSEQAQRRHGSRRDGREHPEDERHGVQLRRARLPGVRDDEVPHRHPRAERLQDRARRRRHPDGVDGAMGIGQAGDRPRLRRRLHPAGVAEARRRLPRSDHRRGAGPRRGAQLGHAAADCRRARGEESDGAAAPPGDADALARHRRGARRHQGVLRPRRHVQGRGHLDLRARRPTTSASAGATATRTASSRSSTSSRARARTRPARRGAASRRSTRWS